MVACHVCSYRKAATPRPGTQRCQSCDKPLCRVHRRRHEGRILCPDCIYTIRRKADARIQAKVWA